MRNTWTLLGGIVIAVVTVVSLIVWMGSDEKDSMMSPNSSTDGAAMSGQESAQDAMEKRSISEQNGAVDADVIDRYVEYSRENFERSSTLRRVLFFYASWCPFCRPADLEFRGQMRDIPDDIAVIRVNYNDPDTDDDEKSLAKKYGVTYQHTFVQIDGDGNAVTRWNGGKLDELLKNIR